MDLAALPRGPGRAATLRSEDLHLEGDGGLQLSGDGTRPVRVQAFVGGSYDGLIRILIDCERFGFKLRSVVAECDEPEAALAVTLDLSVSVSTSPELIRHRLCRHRAVKRMTVEPLVRSLCNQPIG